MDKRLHVFFWVVSLLLLGVFGALTWQLLHTNKVVFTENEGLEIPDLLGSDPLIGSTAPDVVIVFFGDFAQETSADTAHAVRNVLEEFPDYVIVAWKDFPNTSLNSEAYQAALAARCAQDQNNFWAYHDLLMRQQHHLNDELYEAIAKELGLNDRKFSRCLNKEKRADLVDASLQQASDLGLTGAPTLYINNVKYSGKMSTFDLRQIILDHIEE